MTARCVIASLNWETWGHLPVAQHAQTAIAVSSAMHKLNTALCNQSIVNSSVSTMSNLAMATLTAGAAVSQEQQFTTWCWQILTRLRVHLMDRISWECDLVLAQKPDMYKLLLDFDLTPELEALVSAAIGSKDAGACYAVMLLTQVGHSLPEILERGLGFIQTILDSGDYIHTIELIYYILPVLLTDLSALDNDKLLFILTKLMNADNSYISMAKSMLTGAFPGSVTKQIGCMVYKLISTLDNVSQYSRKDVIIMLIKLLTKIQGWTSNLSILYLLDIICSCSFAQQTCYFPVLEFFENIHTENNKKDAAVVSSGFLSYIPKIGGGQQGFNMILEAAGSSFTQFPWLAFFILQAEDNFMQKTGLWKALVNELEDRSSVEEALVAAEKKTLLNSPTSSQLIIYRWAQQAMDTAASHPLAFVFWQKFFILFFSKPTRSSDSLVTANSQESASIGAKFFDSMINSMYFNKLKTSLKSKENSLADCQIHDGELKDRLVQLFTAYDLWLTDDKLIDASVYVPVLKPAYQPPLLVIVMGGENSTWMQYFNTEYVPAIMQECLLDWGKSMHRVRTECCIEKTFSDLILSVTDPETRIIQRLKQFETRLPKPPLRRFSRPIPVTAMDNINDKDTLRQLLMGPLLCLNDFSENQLNNIGAYGSLNCSYLELVPNLWKEEEVSLYVSVPCSGMQVGKEHVACSGPGLVNLTYDEAKICEGIKVSIETNRKKLVEVESILMAPVQSKYVIAAAIVNNVIQRTLKHFEKDLGKGIDSVHLPLGISLFL